jgi:hypothetical protein
MAAHGLVPLGDRRLPDELRRGALGCEALSAQLIQIDLAELLQDHGVMKFADRRVARAGERDGSGMF